MAKFCSPRKILNLTLEVANHRRVGRDYHNNAFRAMRDAALEINRLLVEEPSGYEEMKMKISVQPKVKNPSSRIEVHLKNMLYYASPDIAPQWGLLSALNLKSTNELPPCFEIEARGRVFVFRDDYDDNNMKLIKIADKIRSPLRSHNAGCRRNSQDITLCRSPGFDRLEYFPVHKNLSLCCGFSYCVPLFSHVHHDCFSILVKMCESHSALPFCLLCSDPDDRRNTHAAANTQRRKSGPAAPLSQCFPSKARRRKPGGGLSACRKAF